MEKRKNSKSIRTSLIILLTLAAIIPIVIFGMITYRIIDKAITPLMIDSVTESNDNKTSQLNSFALGFDRTIDDIANSETTKGFLQVRGEDDSNLYYMNLSKLSEKIDSFMVQRADAVDAMTIIWDDGSLPISRTNSYVFPLSENNLGKEPYSKMLNADEYAKWLLHDGNVFLYKGIYNSFPYSRTGVVIIKINSNYVRSIIGANSLSEGYSFISAEGSLLFDNNIGEVIKPDDREMVLSSVETSKSGSSVIDGNSVKYVLTVNTVQTIGCRLVNVAPLSAVVSNQRMIGMSIILTMIIAVLFAVLFSTILFKHINRPLYELERGMLDFQNGNLDARISIDRKDEFGRLSERFNKMATRIQLLIHENEEQQKFRQQTEMKFLQAQITPHFLYNTLNVIKILARQDKTEEVQKMSTDLISLLRLASTGAEKITLDQELEYTENYFELMKIRKDNDMTLEVNVPEILKSTEIPKFTLQPLVENSIIHNTLIENLAVNICASEYPDGIRIIISDNGQGFDESKLKNKSVEKNRFSSIGIENVSSRIKLFYGPRYGVKIHSIIGEGTKAVITIPRTVLTTQNHLASNLSK